MQQKAKQNYGHIQIFYGSQTGTAAKMAQSFCEEAIEKGFQGQVIDLKNIRFEHFDSLNQISIFFLSNTGEGEAPDNTVKFMKILKQKQHLDQIQQTDWSKNAYSVFGLGNTQYEFYNKTGIDVDALLQKRGAKRIYKIGLGDANASLEDDYLQWKNQLWAEMVKFRIENKLESKVIEKNQQQSIKKIVNVDVLKNREYLTSQKPQLANFRFYFCHNQSEKYQFNQQELDFKTKGSLKFQKSGVKNIHQVRQNRNDGSTLQLQIELINQPQYQTAGNIALYPQNDPLIVNQIIKYFKFTQKQLSSLISVQKLDSQKKLKLNFIPYCTLYELLFSHIDIQSRLTKSVLKKLSKFQSINPQYFTTNSSPKTTAQFKRITQDPNNNTKNWFYLFRIIQQQQVKINFEDFVQLSDSMAPRVFTIGSAYNKQKNVIVMASIIENGLISKYFNAQPNSIRAELRKSSFVDAMKWKKVVFIGAGTGFAPFRGFLQDKQYLMEKEKNGEQVKYPKVTLIFGCKYSNGDFIYKNQIQKWVQTQVINNLHMAFSREKQMKVYVQHLLAEQQHEIKEFLENQQSAVYICGALNMGHDVSQILAQKAGGHEKIKQLQQKGRIIKQLW